MANENEAQEKLKNRIITELVDLPDGAKLHWAETRIADAREMAANPNKYNWQQHAWFEAVIEVYDEVFSVK